MKKVLQESINTIKWLMGKMVVIDSSDQSDSFNIPMNTICLLEKELELYESNKIIAEEFLNKWDYSCAGAMVAYAKLINDFSWVAFEEKTPPPNQRILIRYSYYGWEEVVKLTEDEIKDYKENNPQMRWFLIPETGIDY